MFYSPTGMKGTATARLQQPCEREPTRPSAETKSGPAPQCIIQGWTKYLNRNPALKGRARGTKPAARADGPYPQPLSHERGRGEHSTGL